MPTRLAGNRRTPTLPPPLDANHIGESADRDRRVPLPALSNNTECSGPFAPSGLMSEAAPTRTTSVLVSHPSADPAAALLSLGVNKAPPSCPNVEVGPPRQEALQRQPLALKAPCLPNPVSRCFCVVETQYD